MLNEFPPKLPALQNIVNLSIPSSNHKPYDFSINSEKFMREFNFEFNDTVETIVDNILSNPHNDKWQKRDTK